jgi:hypothetical protein
MRRALRRIFSAEAVCRIVRSFLKFIFSVYRNAGGSGRAVCAMAAAASGAPLSAKPERRFVLYFQSFF